MLKDEAQILVCNRVEQVDCDLKMFPTCWLWLDDVSILEFERMYDLYIMPARRISDSRDLTHDSLSQYGNFIYHFI